MYKLPNFYQQPTECVQNVFAKTLNTWPPRTVTYGGWGKNRPACNAMQYDIFQIYTILIELTFEFYRVEKVLTQFNHYSWGRDLDKFAWLMVTFFTLSTHQSSSVSFCRPLWVTPSRSSSSWRTLSVASVSLLLTSSLSSDRPCEERSSSYRTESQLWITVAGATAIRSQAGVYIILVMNHRW